MELGYLTSVVASMIGWIALIVERDELNLDSPEGAEFRTKALYTKAELLASLDNAVANARRALESTNDEHLAKPWAFKMGGNPVSQNPRSVMIADSVSATWPTTADSSRSICASLRRRSPRFSVPLPTSASRLHDL